MLLSSEQDAYAAEPSCAAYLDDAPGGAGSGAAAAEMAAAFWRGVPAERVTRWSINFRALDGLIEISWYTYQLHRIAHGQDPDPGVWPWTVLLRMGWNMYAPRSAR